MYPSTSLIAVENTFYGRIVPQDFIRRVRVIAKEHNLPVHLDGARLWNTATALKLPLDYFTKDVDSVSLCLSKGLGAPGT
jgi:threonine aldolase